MLPNLQKTEGLITFTEEILNGKLLFLQFRNLNTINLKIPPNKGWICIFDRKFSKYSGERKSLNESIEVWEDVSFRLILKELGCWSTVCSLTILLILTWGLRYWKKRGNKKRGHWFWNGGLRYLCILTLVVEENSCRVCLFWGGFLVEKSS